MKLKKIVIFLIIFILVFQSNTYANIRIDTDNQNQLIIDTTNGYYENGRYYLGVDDDVTSNYYLGFYKIGYVIPGEGKGGSDLFVEFGENMILDTNIYSKLINIEYLPKCIMFNDTIVYTDYNSFQDEYNVPFIYDGRDIIVKVKISDENEKLEISGIEDDKGNKVDILKGAKITPIYKYRDHGEETYFPVDELINYHVLELDEVKYDDNLKITMTTYDKDDYAVKLEIITNDNKLVISKPIMLMDEVKFEEKIAKLFSNEKPSDWAVPDITEAIKYGIITDNTMKNYQANITREEFCELAVKLYEKLSKKTAQPIENNPFSDIDNVEVLKAYNLKIVSGIGDGMFAPERSITREQLAVMLYNTVEAALVNQDEESDNSIIFKDKENISSWAVEAMKYMSSKKFIVGNDGMVSPKNNTTIEQAIIIAKRVYKYYQS